MNPFTVSPKNIWNFRQNKVSRIARDLGGSDKETVNGVYKILLARGVFKWFAARRQIIRLKNEWKDIINWSITFQHHARDQGWWTEVWYQRGYRAAMNKCRQDLRAVCHSDRWSVDPKDRDAVRWLEHQTAEADRREAAKQENQPVARQA